MSELGRSAWETQAKTSETQAKASETQAGRNGTQAATQASMSETQNFQEHKRTQVGTQLFGGCVPRQRELKISYGNSRQSKVWSNKTITFDALCERLSTTIRTSETAEEYPELSKAERDEIKDKGGFVAGHLRDNRRQRKNVACRSMLVYDLDKASAEFLSGIEAVIPNAGFYYTTHSHRPDHPRARMIIPVTRDMTPDEFNAVARYYAADTGFIDMLDPCSFSPHQLMYWPTTPANGEFLCGRLAGEWLSPEAVLASHPDWKDLSLLPTTPEESRVPTSKGSKQKDPLEKEGIVGVFCRAYYPIQLAIDKFLTNVYKVSAVDGRYDYARGEGSAGVVIYDNKYAFSHHATDPAGGKLCNAFDIVRAHLFGEDESSFKKMCEFAMEQDEVKILSLEEKQRAAREDFRDPDDWKKELRYMARSQKLENSVWNLMLILENDPDFANFAFNAFVGRVQITGKVPWERATHSPFWRDADTAQLKALIDIRYEAFSNRNYDVAFSKIVEDRSFNPLKEELISLPAWDGVTRLENLYIDFLGAKDTAYVKAATRKSFVAAVARIFEPGRKFDSVVVLVGPQGCGKSTLFAKLGGAYYSDSLTLTDMKDKSGAEKLQGYWIMELGELAGMKKADLEAVKAFVSRTDDIYRPSYGHVVESHPRQCVIVGTTNSETGFLRDITGNRRFWPITVSGESKRKSWDITKEEVQQLWAEAKHLYEAGEPLYLDQEESSAALSEQIGAMEADERQGIVEEYLERLLPENWSEMDLYDRRNFLSDGIKGTVQRTTVSNAEIWSECFGRSLSDLKPADSYAIAALMTKVDGWQRTDKTRKLPVYGRQRLYVRL